MSFNISLTPETGVALLEWEDRLFAMWQTQHHAKLMIDPLSSAGLAVRAKEAAKIYQDINEQLVTGELVTRMIRIHAEVHPCLRGRVESELLRQFTNVLVPYLFADVSEARKEQLQSVADEYRQAALTATEEKHED